ncbi:MAG: DUF1566 domain-containing protein [Candidatus Nitrohelix vancouverensis]|uniref:DUF1566 domain-containing protein n=1 Tax=Candidatus Nitrohelix vancouverensis TaxID=2705534 RepID=A0A7T0C1Z2_9BACT|nr:MAG: DUF1566 domain-containing protein [Candidatus Nitrohelix vancouverensis]
MTTDNKRFEELEDGVILDRPQSLMWMKQDTWQMTGKWMNHVQIRTYVEQLNKTRHAGFGNWRIPSPAEAKSLYNKEESNTDFQGKDVNVYNVFEPGFGFLCWTSEIRNKLQALRFGYRKGLTTYDDVYRTSRGASRLVRDLDEDVN